MERDQLIDLTRRAVKLARDKTTDLAPTEQAVQASDYTSIERHSRDVEMLMASPQLVGYVSELPAPGSYCTKTVMGRSVLLTRTSDGKIKAFNNIYFEHLRDLARPKGSPERSVLAIAGDDAEAKLTVTEVLDDLGYDAYDVGPLAEGWRYQRDTAAYATLYATGPAGTWPPQGSRRVDVELLKEKLDAAQRYRDMA